MKLNKDEKIMIAGAIKMLGGYKDQSFNNNTNKADGRDLIPSEEHTKKSQEAIKDYLHQIDKDNYTEFLDDRKDDKELLKVLADKTFNLVKKEPELMQELKEKYFKTL